MSDQLTELTDNNLEDRLLQNDKPVLVDFWAPWCGPCKAIAPTLEELGASYSGRATIGKLNVDENPTTASRFRVQAIPTLILFKDGEEKERLIGAQSKASISELLDRYAA